MKTKNVDWAKRVLIALSIFATLGQSWANTKEYSDGPYAKAKGRTLHFEWIHKGEKHEHKVKNARLPYCFKKDGLRADIHTLKFLESKTLTYKGKFPVAAISDPHGQYDLMYKLMVANKIIDKKGRWKFKKGHFVITGDIFDRGDKVTEILWLVYRLEKEAEKAGGKVHLLLGNHEVMVLNGSLSYLHEKYKHTAKALETPFDQLFTDKTILGNWLRSKPVLVRINNMLFTHGGFHPELAEKGHTIEKINKAFKKTLVGSELSKKRDSWASYLHGGNGPVWYRGYFKDDGATSAEVDLLVKHFDVDHIIVGHTSQKKILTRHKGKVIAIDSSMKGGRYAEILFVDGKKMTRGTPEGKRLPLE